MIIRVDGYPDIDTERDLTPAEKHIIQKLFGWKDLVNSVEEFEEKVSLCFVQGWNSSGTVRQSNLVRRIVKQLEGELKQRLQSR